MPRTKFQGIIFGIIMSYCMAIGMEVYNIAIKMGFPMQPGGFSSMTNAVFPAALQECGPTRTRPPLSEPVSTDKMRR